MMHKWWARRLGVVFRMLLLSQASRTDASAKELWQQFYAAGQLPQGFTVLDPFLGGGTSLVEAAKLGANCVGFDIDPVACFVTQMELSPADPNLIGRRFREIEEAISDKIRRLYRSSVNGESVEVIYYFWVDFLMCPDCGAACPGHPTFQLAHAKDQNWQVVVCPSCEQLAEIRLDAKFVYCKACGKRTDLGKPPVTYGKFQCPICSYRTAIHDLYRRGLADQRPFAHEYLRSDGERGFAAVGSADLRSYREATLLLQQHEADLPIPNARIPAKGRSDQRPLLYGYHRYRELFNARQLYCLGLIASEIQKTEDQSVRRALGLAFSHCLASNNMFRGYAFGYRRLTPLFSVHSFRKISRPVEGNVWGIELGRGSFKNAVRAVIAGSEYMLQPYEYKYRNGGEPVRVSVALGLQAPKGATHPKAATVNIVNQSSEDLMVIRSRSVDLILTDPPYFDNLSYSELSDFYHVWLREVLGSDYPGHSRAHTPLGESLFGGKRSDDASAEETRRRYTATLTKVLRECHRVAKDDAVVMFTYHHRSSGAWECLGTSLLESGFEVRDVFPVRSEGRSGLHSYAGSIKWDSVFLCRKRSLEAMVPPSPQALHAVAHRAANMSRYWRNRLRRAGLEFGPADEASLTMALVLTGFSNRSFHPRTLNRALTKAVALCEQRSRCQRQRPRSPE